MAGEMEDAIQSISDFACLITHAAEAALNPDVASMFVRVGHQILADAATLERQREELWLALHPGRAELPLVARKD
jgi:hypothetical protein